MVNVFIGKSGRPVVTGGMFGCSNITDSFLNKRVKVKVGDEEFTSYEGAVNQLVDDGMTTHEACKFIEAVR